MKLFEYAVIFVPRSNDNNKAAEKPRVIVPVTTTLAHDQSSVQLQAARQIPEDYAERLDQVQVVVRPF